MPLFIRDDEVDALAARLQKATGAGSKKEAVKTALKHELERVRRALPLRHRLAEAMKLADAMGPNDPAFDLKRYSDEMWGQ